MLLLCVSFEKEMENGHAGVCNSEAISEGFQEH
jgi:hypothetical protein